MPNGVYFASGDALKKMMRKSKAGRSLDFGHSCWDIAVDQVNLWLGMQQLPGPSWGFDRNSG